MKNTKYLEAIKDSCSITEYLAFIDSEIVKEIIDTAITKETDITLREKLLDERVKILTELLELANEDLVMNDSTTKENLDFRV